MHYNLYVFFMSTFVWICVSISILVFPLLLINFIVTGGDIVTLVISYLL
uniref:Uncharacterized protein n=1 Tax=Arundo donax TaxID=35708 RepID=A0A0A8YE72_ARUDO